MDPLGSRLESRRDDLGNLTGQGGLYMGGTEQILIRKPWCISGVEIVDRWDLK